MHSRIHTAADGDRIHHPNGAQMHIRVKAADTAGAYSMMETILPPGGMVAPHVHEGEDENNLILAGTMTMYIGKATYDAVVGDYVVAPRGIEQHFINTGTTDCRFLTMFTPGGAEGFFLEASALIRDTLPHRPTPERMAQLARTYGLTYF